MVWTFCRVPVGVKSVVLVGESTSHESHKKPSARTWKMSDEKLCAPSRYDHTNDGSGYGRELEETGIIPVYASS
jgi:hypothetical protein